MAVLNKAVLNKALLGTVVLGTGRIDGNTDASGQRLDCADYAAGKDQAAGPVDLAAPAVAWVVPAGAGAGRRAGR